MTRRIINLSENNSLSEILRITALTLTKLNHQVTYELYDNDLEFIKRAGDENINLILVDLEYGKTDVLDVIKKIRKSPDSSHKKITGYYTLKSEQKNPAFEAGCDSVMSAEELKLISNNLFSF
ncbi:MAG TPA: hypothetical protein DEP28_05400 [Bacteroidetes bacterium]|nr:hypothetical protein [Bacteroidota bacterium]HCN36212.1 hypothetical protein [Bacteroidota bacterium]